MAKLEEQEIKLDDGKAHVVVFLLFQTLACCKGTIALELVSAALERNVKVKLLLSDWDHSRPSIRNYAKSLTSLDQIDAKVSVQAKMFKVMNYGVAENFTECDSTFPREGSVYSVDTKIYIIYYS